MSARKLKSFFRLNRRDSVNPDQVHDLIHQVQDRMGIRNAGTFGFAPADHQGYYWVAFERDDTADLFERLYRNAGGKPNRQRRAPQGVRMVTPETVETAVWNEIIASVAVFLTVIAHTDPRRRAAQWN